MASRRKFLFDQHQLIAFCKNFERTNEDTLTEQQLEVKDRELERRRTLLVDSFDKVFLEPEKEHDVELDFTDSNYQKYEEATQYYHNCKAALIARRPTKPVHKSNEDSKKKASHTLKLPPCDIPTFEGGYSNWPPFRDIFIAVFGNHEDLSAVQKLYHLRSKTKGEAHEIVKRFDLVEENFDFAWEALKTRYENKRILVQQQIKKLFGISAVQNESPKALRQILSSMEDSLSILQSYQVSTESWDPMLVHLAATKLPEETLRAWEDSLENHKELPSWRQMRNFLSNRTERLEAFIDLRKSNSRDTKTQSFITQPTEGERKPYCSKCEQNHPIRQCKKFLELSSQERVQYAMANKYCLNCLSHNHFKKQCKSTYRCAKCKKSHHTLLHIDKKASPSHPHTNTNRFNGNAREEEKPSTSGFQIGQNSFLNTQSVQDQTQTFLANSNGTTILPTALINVEHAGELYSVRALLDSGSERSFISSRMQQRLNIPVEYHSTRISGLGGAVVGNSKGRCHLTLQSRCSDFRINIKTLVVPNLAHFLPSRPVKVHFSNSLENLQLADPFFNQPGSIDLIIGSDYLPQINMEGVLTCQEKTIEARESQFGWYLSGPTKDDAVNTFSTLISIPEDVSLREQLKMFWEIEDVDGKKSERTCDDHCEEFYKETTKRDSNGRYVVRLPFKQEFPQKIFLAPSKNAAYAQYLRMEKTLSKTPELQNDYNKVLQEYIDLGHMKRISHTEGDTMRVSYFFLPHHAVIRPESKTTKVRVVFNASKKTGSGFSLNDCLHTGPILQQDISKIIINWRFYKFVISGDIQKMYRQIGIHHEDQSYQLILHRPAPNLPICTYQLTTVTFGINVAPFLAIRTLIQLGKECEPFYPQASSILQHEVYVDDILSGGHTVEEATEKRNQIVKALQSAGFPLKKIAANHSTLLQNIPPEDLLDEEFLKIEDHSTTKALGIRWDAMTDTFYFVVVPIETSSVTSKRRILSSVAKFFDPIGWLGPIIITAKIILQDIWLEGIDWDDNVPPHILVKWLAFVASLHTLSKIRVPRWVNFSPSSKIEIHGFSDASEKAYCATLYLRAVATDGKTTCHLLAAKTKVAPIKTCTIPKLELCGSLLLTRLLQNTIKDKQEVQRILLWTDSSIVLGWLQKSPQTLKTFVANRVSEILDKTDVSQWRHVRSEDNPADLGSRGVTTEELAESSLWWHGPSWLTKDENHWPEIKDFEPCDLEVKKVKCHVGICNEDILNRFSGLQRCLRVISYVLRFYRICRRQPIPTSKEISAEELMSTQKKLIIITQQEAFQKEYSRLRDNLPISSRSPLLIMKPFLDDQGIIRVGGRLANSHLTYNEKHPIILPTKARLTHLLVEFSHKILLHAEHHIMLRAIRQGFHIPRLKNLVKTCVRKCRTCTLYKHKVQTQVMAHLPPERVQFSLPFTYTGVDFAGPFNIRSSTLRNAKILKGYAVVFVCFSTKAVHLETCSDLSTEAFLAAFDRFTGRRGLPKTMFSDNGRNFVGASHQLMKIHEQFLKGAEKTIAEKYCLHGFHWSFIPPHAPHMGGLWEAAVKSMKSHLKKVAQNMNFTFEEFTTLLVKIEAVLNSRPLSPMTENPEELLPLTPGHFLRGAPLTAPPEILSEKCTEDTSLLRRWEKIKAVHRLFCHRWKSEYITELQRRYKWKTVHNNIKEDDFVVIKEDFLPPTEWRLGRVTKVHRGDDNNVRVVELITQNGRVIRPITKLCVLPTN